MMIDKIRNTEQYDEVMERIEIYLQKATKGGGFNVLTQKEEEELGKLSLMAETYEDLALQLAPFQSTLPGIVKSKMEEKGITQKDLPDLLNINNHKISQILKGHRKPDLQFLKAIHEKLGIDGNIILEYA